MLGFTVLASLFGVSFNLKEIVLWQLLVLLIIDMLLMYFFAQYVEIKYRNYKVTIINLILNKNNDKAIDKEE